MDSIPSFGLARWLYCLEDMVPMGVAGLLSSPCLGTVEYTVLGKLITDFQRGVSLDTFLCEARGQSKGKHAWPRNLCDPGS